MILIKNASIYSPKHLGEKSILVGGKKILAIEDEINCELADTVIDASGKYLVPGFIDHHVHVTGGGGEAGFISKAPEVRVEDLIKSGTTTVCGLLGTDGVTRSVENLVSKIYAIRDCGLSAFCFTGSYKIPTPTLTGDIQKDLVFLDPVIGMKIAISDHRSSNPTIEELIRVASEVRVGGMISGKSGTIIVHVGKGKRRLDPLVEAIQKSDLPITVFHPTHCNRNQELLENSFEFLKMGGSVDYTCGLSTQMQVVNVINQVKQNNIPSDFITLSSDGNGSFCKYDDNGNLIKIGITSVDKLFEEFKNLTSNGFSIEESLPFFTTNVARVLGIKNKGQIKKGFDADMLLLDDDYNIDTVIANGKIFLKDGNLFSKSAISF